MACTTVPIFPISAWPLTATPSGVVNGPFVIVHPPRTSAGTGASQRREELDGVTFVFPRGVDQVCQPGEEGRSPVRTEWIGIAVGQLVDPGRQRLQFGRGIATSR